MKKPRPDFSFELQHRAAGRIIVGVDEVGRGCLAGPVVTAAVVLPEHVFASTEEGWWLELNDSKLVKPAKREELSQIILREARVQIAWCSPEEIDRWNILHAAMVAMRRALAPFAPDGVTPCAVLVDGHINPFASRYSGDGEEFDGRGFASVETLVKGDQRSRSIAAASIVAKVYRDQWMARLDTEYPGYAFGEHKGYTTPAHYAAIEKLGPCAIHRRSFAPFRPEDCSDSDNGVAGKQINLDV